MMCYDKSLWLKYWQENKIKIIISSRANYRRIGSKDHGLVRDYKI